MTTPWWIYPFKPVPVDAGILDRIDRSRYTMEPKMDGWRAWLIVQNGRAELWTRQKNKIEVPANLKAEIADLKLPEGTVLDGEIWNPEKRGGWKHSNGVDCRLSFWDAVRVGGRDIGQEPIETRREAMRSVIGVGTPSIEIVRVLPAERAALDEIRAEAMAAQAVTKSKSGFVHGVVLKRNTSPRRDSAMRSVEHADWMKIVMDRELERNIVS